MTRPTRGGRHQSRKAAENAAQESAHHDTERDSIIAGTTSSTKDTGGVRTDTANATSSNATSATVLALEGHLDNQSDDYTSNSSSESDSNGSRDCDKEMEELINSKKNSKQPFAKYSRSQWCDKHQKVVEKNQKLTNEVQDLKEKARQNKAAKKALEKEKDKTAEKDRNMITVKYELDALRKALKSSQDSLKKAESFAHALEPQRGQSRSPWKVRPNPELPQSSCSTPQLILPLSA